MESKGLSFGELQPSRDAFKYFEVGMKGIGWKSPPKGGFKYWSYRFYSFLVIALSGAYLPFGFFASYFIDFRSFSPGDFLTSIQVAFNSACLGIKIVILVPNLWRFAKAKEFLDILDKRCVQAGYSADLDRTVKLCNSIYMIYQISYPAYSILTLMSSVLVGTTPWGFYLPLRSKMGGLWGECIIELFIAHGAVWMDQLVDVYPVLFGFLLRTHLQLLTKRIERFGSYEGTTEADNYEELVNCIKDHKNILEFCEIFRPIISGTIFAQFLVIGLGLGLAMVNLLFFSTIWSGMATVVYISILLIETFPFCYLSELIIEDCSNLTNAMFHSDWVDSPKAYKSTLIFFLHQSQQPITFMAGGIFPICMKTNIEMAKLAFTVVTVVNQMNIVEQLT